MKELVGNDRKKLFGIIHNHPHQLSVDTVLYNSLPGSVYVDEVDLPQSFFIKTPECNLIGGNAHNDSFNESIKTKIQYFDSIICDSAEWSQIIHTLHPNCALKAFRRRYLTNTRGTEVYSPKGTTARNEYIYANDLPRIQYENKNLLLNWINIRNVDKITDVPLAAIVIVDDTIVSCSAVDCMEKNEVEIGIKTNKRYQRQGYGVWAVSSLINKLQSAGVSHIGWHCMDTNVGSQRIAVKCGFEQKCTYEALYPFPPIENETDLSIPEWHKLGSFYLEKGKQAADQYWQSARCFAHAKDEQWVLFCIKKLIENNQNWFVDHVDECEEFQIYKGNVIWDQLIQSANAKST